MLLLFPFRCPDLPQWHRSLMTRAAIMSALLLGLPAVISLCAGSRAVMTPRAYVRMTDTSQFFAVVHEFNDCEVCARSHPQIREP